MKLIDYHAIGNIATREPAMSNIIQANGIEYGTIFLQFHADGRVFTLIPCWTCADDGKPRVGYRADSRSFTISRVSRFIRRACNVQYGRRFCNKFNWPQWKGE